MKESKHSRSVWFVAVAVAALCDDVTQRSEWRGNQTRLRNHFPPPSSTHTSSLALAAPSRVTLFRIFHCPMHTAQMFMSSRTSDLAQGHECDYLYQRLERNTGCSQYVMQTWKYLMFDLYITKCMVNRITAGYNNKLKMYKLTNIMGLLNY